MNKDVFIDSVCNLGLCVDDSILKKLDIYYKFLVEYNKHTNLTSIIEESDVYLKHFYDSLTLCKVINLNDYDTFLDVGTGAGFPGVVIAIFFPKLSVTLVDSNGKKIKFLEELVKKLDIKNVNIINDRVENIYEEYLNYFDVVTSRAVAQAKILVEMCMPVVKVNGFFVLMKGSNDSEISDSLYAIEKMDGDVVEHIKFNLCNQDKRNILLIKKNKLTNIKNIRRYEKIIKRPLQKINK